MSVSTVYTVTATNTGGSDTAAVTIVVNDELPVIAYSPSSFTLTKGTAMTTNTPTVIGGVVTSWSISPTLPTGLAFDTSTGAISGTPTVLSVSTAYTVTGTNSGGSDTAAVTIVVNDAVPVIAYSPSSFTLTKGTAMTTVHQQSGGAIVSLVNFYQRYQQALPLTLQHGAISGTPTVLVRFSGLHCHATKHRWKRYGCGDDCCQRCSSSHRTYSPQLFTLTKGTAMTT